MGKNYAMVITTSGGLWRYQIGDTVRFTSLYPHKFVISGRTKNFINAFGEELMVDNADKAISSACRLTGAKVKEYTAAPLFMLDRAKNSKKCRLRWMNSPPCWTRPYNSLTPTTRQNVIKKFPSNRWRY